MKIHIYFFLVIVSLLFCFVNVQAQERRKITLSFILDTTGYSNEIIEKQFDRYSRILCVDKDNKVLSAAYVGKLSGATTSMMVEIDNATHHLLIFGTPHFRQGISAYSQKPIVLSPDCDSYSIPLKLAQDVETIIRFKFPTVLLPVQKIWKLTSLNNPNGCDLDESSNLTSNNEVRIWGTPGSRYMFKMSYILPMSTIAQSTPAFTIADKQSTVIMDLPCPTLMEVKYLLQDEEGNRRPFVALDQAQVGQVNFPAKKGEILVDPKSDLITITDNCITFDVGITQKKEGYKVIAGKTVNIAATKHEVVVRRLPDKPTPEIGVSARDGGAPLKSFLVCRAQQDLSSMLGFDYATHRYSSKVFTAYNHNAVSHPVPLGKYDILAFSPGYRLKLFPNVNINTLRRKTLLGTLDPGQKVVVKITNIKERPQAVAAIVYPPLYPLKEQEIAIDSQTGTFAVVFDPRCQPLLAVMAPGCAAMNYVALAGIGATKDLAIAIHDGVRVNGKIGGQLRQFIADNDCPVLVLVPESCPGIFTGRCEVETNSDKWSLSMMPGKYAAVLLQRGDTGFRLPQTIEVKEGMSEIVLDQLPKDTESLSLPRLFFGKGFTPFDIAEN